MTREEAIAIIRKEYLCVDRECEIERNCGKCDLVMPSKEPILQAYTMAIKALEQEPCEDAISRHAVLDMIQMRMSGKELYKAVYDLPPVNPQPKYEDIAKAFQFGLAFGFGEKHDEMDEVIDEINKKVITPQPKTGHWINIDATHSKCDRCEAVFEIVSENGEVNYCPKCGIKMIDLPDTNIGKMTEIPTGSEGSDKE